MTDLPTTPSIVLGIYRREYDRARARVDEVNANPDAQRWEVEQARDSLSSAERALDVHVVGYAMAGLS